MDTAEPVNNGHGVPMTVSVSVDSLMTATVAVTALVVFKEKTDSVK